MIASLRLRLQLWYAVVLVAVIASYAWLLYYRVRQARLQEINSQLDTAAHYLDAVLRRFPGPPPRDREIPGRDLPRQRPGPRRDDPRPEREGGPRPRRPPPPFDRERLLGELDLPPTLRGGPPGEGFYFAVWRPDGHLLKSVAIPRDLTPPLRRDDPGPRLTLVWRGGSREAVLHVPQGTIVVGRSMHAELARLEVFAWQLAGAGGIVLALGLAGGWVVATRILRPIAVISATAAAISEDNLSERIATTGIDSELRGLADVLNATFDRLEAAFARQVQFTADASHELRTPLAILRSHAELALARDRTGAEYREALATCLQAAQRMTTLVETLLLLARADAGRLALDLGPVDLAGVVEDCVELLRPLAAQRCVTLRSRLGPVEVEGDANRLGQVVTNLLSNAIHYNRPGGEVELTLDCTDEGALLAVADNGCGIPREDLPHLFERFYRVDRARSRASGGHGLGLAICKTIVEAHGGRIWAESRPGRGSTFRVRLPGCPLDPGDPSEG